MKRLLAVAMGAVALSGCGAQEASVVKSAFEQDITSAEVTLSLSMASGQDETSLGLTGPYRSNGEGKLPSVDWDVTLAGPAPQPIEAGLISTGDDAFVEYRGETYQVGRDKLSQLNLGGGLGSTDLKQIMGHMRDWFPSSDLQENATLHGEAVTRVTGKLDLSVALKDMQALGGLKQLRGADLREIEKSLSDPRFTVDIAKSDGKLRRIAARMTMDDGSEKGTISFSLQLKNVDKPVTITAPSSGKPIEELMRQLQQDFGGAAAPSESTIS